MAKVTGGKLEFNDTTVKATGGTVREVVDYEATDDTGNDFDANGVAFKSETAVAKQLVGTIDYEYHDDADLNDDPPDLRPGSQVGGKIYTSGRSGTRYFDGTFNVKSHEITWSAKGVVRGRLEVASEGGYTYN